MWRASLVIAHVNRETSGKNGAANVTGGTSGSLGMGDGDGGIIRIWGRRRR